MEQNSNHTQRIEYIFAVLTIVLISAITYLPLAKGFGYYFDDWNLIWAGHTQGPQKLIELYSIDRPFMGYVFAGMYTLLGDSALPWSICGYIIRLVGAFGLFSLLRMLWPNQRFATTAMSLLFIVYPGFLRQPNAIQYQMHIINFTLAILSIAISIRAWLSKNRLEVFLLTILAMIFAMGSFLMMEYMIGLEGLRLFLLWYITPIRKEEKRSTQLSRVLKRWIPYLTVIIIFLFWRVFIFTSTRYATSIEIIVNRYIESPVYRLINLSAMLAKDFIETAFYGWTVPPYQLMAHARLRDFGISILFGAAGVTIFLLYIWWLKIQNDALLSEKQHNPDSWCKAAVWIGVLSILCALLPINFSDRHVYFSSSFDRYTLPGTIGAVMLLIGGLFWTVKGSFRIWLPVALIGLSVMTHYHNAVYFANYWSSQRELWWQMSWRAPQLEEGTVLMVTLRGGFPLEEDYEIWGPASLIYYPEPGALKIFSEVLNLSSAQAVQRGAASARNMRSIKVKKDFANTLMLSMPSSYSCLHVIDGQRPELSEYESSLVSMVAPSSRIDLIMINEPAMTPSAAIFGREPEHTWCYYYQKAALAVQKENWEEAAHLGNEAKEKGFRSRDAYELMPFVEAYIHTGEFIESEMDGTMAIIKESPPLRARICEGLENSPYDEIVQRYLSDHLCN